MILPEEKRSGRRAGQSVTKAALIGLQAPPSRQPATRTNAARRSLRGLRAALTLLPLLGAAETLLYRFMPVTVGQLATFRFDGTVSANPVHDDRSTELRGVTSMLERSVSG